MNEKDTPDVLQLDVNAVIKDRLPKQYKYIPRGMIKWMAKTICQEEMNELLRNNAGCRGADFCHGVLRDLEITYTVDGEENLPKYKRAIFISNHPLGGLDGIVLMDYIASVYGKEFKFLVNDLLMAIEPLRDVFLPINKHGNQSREASAAVDEAFAGDEPILIFPAGLCSRSQNGTVRDLKWQKTFVNKAIRYERPIVPIHFKGENSKSFYRKAKLREKSGLKFNIEMIYLPREVFRKRGAHFDISIGKPIDYRDLKGGKDAQKTADELKEIVYAL